LSKSSGQSEALGALANIASGSTERQISIYKAQVTRKSVALLSDHDVDVRRSAASLIMNLAPHAKIKERIVEAGALKAIAAALKDDDNTLKDRAAGALANLFNDHGVNVQTGFEQAPDMIPSLVAIISDPDSTIDGKRQAAHALAMLAAENGPCDAVWSGGAGQPMIQLLEEMIAEAALAIMNLSWRWPHVKQELAKAGALELLVQMLRTGDSMGKEYATGALMNMTAGSEENATAVVSIVPHLVELLKSEGIQAAEWSAGALANVVRASKEGQKMAADLDAPTHLAKWLPKVTPNGRTLLVLALISIADGEAATVKAAISGREERGKLREFQESGESELVEYIKTLMKTVGGGYSL